MTAPADPLFCRRRETPFGPLALFWSLRDGQAGVVRIALSRPDAPAGCLADAQGLALPDADAPLIDDLVARIDAFFAGDPARFPLTGIRLDLCPPFQRRVLLAEYGVPRGAVTTYRLLAERLGQPRAARAAGMALATNPFPLVIPCHRAIRSDGTLGGYQGGLAMKRALLEREGVLFEETRCGAPRVKAGFVVPPPLP